MASVLFVAACGGDDDDDTSATPDASVVADEPDQSPPPDDSSVGDGSPATTAGESADTDPPAELTPEVVMSINSDPSPLDPILLVTPEDRVLSLAVFEPLVELSDDGELVPGLATSWESEDAQTWTVTLREGVEFSDGTPFNADAVVANYARAQDPEKNARFADVSALDSITIIDDYTLEFLMTQPLASFPAFLNDGFSNMVSPSVLDGDVGANPVGTGAFMLERRGPDEISFVRNPNYWNPEQPRAERLVYRIIPDPQAQLAALQAGDIDLMTNTNDSANAQAEPLDGVEVLSKPGIGTMHVFLNATRPPFDDVNARLALAHATDREAYVQFTNSDGEGEIVDGPFPSGMPVSGSPRAANWPAYDPELARQMVDELGGLSFTLLTYTVGSYPLQAQLLQDMWAQAGIDVEIELQDVPTVVADAAARTMDAVLTPWSGRADPDLNAFRYLHSAADTSPSGIKDDVLDDLLVRARETPDLDERKALYQQLVDRIAEIVPVIYLEGLPKSVIHSSDLAGVVMPPDGLIRPQYLYIEP